jgi:hypothetical protein
VLTRPNRVVCADTAAKGVSAGSAESMIGYKERTSRGGARGGTGAVEGDLRLRVEGVMEPCARKKVRR